MNTPRLRLVLYSNQLIPETAEIDRQLLVLLGKERARIGYIPSAGDPDRKYYRAQKAYYARYGLDLTPYFELEEAYRPDLFEALWSADAIHLSGGDTVHFLQALKRRNLLDPLRRYAAQGGVLVGVSAGAILMTLDIRTTFLCGDEPASEAGDNAGLGLVDFAFVPHWGRYGSITELEAYARQNNITLYACPDSAGIVVNDDRVQCMGDILVIGGGTTTK